MPQGDVVGEYATPTKGHTNDRSSGLSTESVVASDGLLMHAGNVRSCRRIAFGSWPLSMVGTKTANEGSYSECRIGAVGLRATPCEGAFNSAMSREGHRPFGAVEYGQHQRVPRTPASIEDQRVALAVSISESLPNQKSGSHRRQSNRTSRV